MDDPLRVRRKRLDIKVYHVLRPYTEHDIIGKYERKSEQKKKTEFIQNGENDLRPLI